MTNPLAYSVTIPRDASEEFLRQASLTPNCRVVKWLNQDEPGAAPLRPALN
jgi:hypothetical protein